MSYIQAVWERLQHEKMGLYSWKYSVDWIFWVRIKLMSYTKNMQHSFDLDLI